MKKEELLKIAIEAGEDKKALEVKNLDVSKVSSVTENFVVMSGKNDKQTKAIADNIEEKLEEAGEEVIRREGYDKGRWIILDYGFMIVHVFTPDEREIYNIEKLWEEFENPEEVKEESNDNV